VLGEKWGGESSLTAKRVGEIQGDVEKPAGSSLGTERAKAILEELVADGKAVREGNKYRLAPAAAQDGEIAEGDRHRVKSAEDILKAVPATREAGGEHLANLPQSVRDQAVRQFNTLVDDFAEEGIHLDAVDPKAVPHLLTPSWRIAERLAKGLETVSRGMDREQAGKGSSPEYEAALRDLESILGKGTGNTIQSAIGAASGSTAPNADAVVNGKPRDPSIPADESLLLMPCGGKKLDVTARADKLYVGPLWQTLRERATGKMPRLAILSAKHGIVAPETELAPYDEQMTKERADELLKDLPALSSRVAAQIGGRDSEARDVQIVGGAEYRRVMRAVVARLQQTGRVAMDASIRETDGPGIGHQRKQLGDYLATFTREIITPSEDKAIGNNDAGEPLYERKDGSVYRMHAGKPDFGGDLASAAAPAPAAASKVPLEIRTLPLNERWDALVARTKEDGGDPDKGQRSYRAFTSLVTGATGEKPMDVWSRWSSGLGSTDLANRTGDEVLKWMESNLPSMLDGYIRGMPGANTNSMNNQAGYWQGVAKEMERRKPQHDQYMARLEAQVNDVEELAGNEEKIAAARKIIGETNRAWSRNERTVQEGLKAAEKHEADEQSRIASEELAAHKPFDAKALSAKPTPASMFGWFSANYEGRKVWTDGHVLDLTGEPHIKGWENRVDTLGRNKDGKLDVSRVIPKEEGHLAKPIGWFDKAYGSTFKNGIVYFDVGGEVGAIDTVYVRYFLSKYKGATFHATGPNTSYQVRHDGKLVGVVMPIVLTKTQEKAPTVDEIKAKVGAEKPAAKAVEASDDETTPAISEAQARKQLEWRNLGQKDGTKTHALFFFEKAEDKGTGRSMGQGLLTRFDGATNWQLNGESTGQSELAAAKRVAEDAAMQNLRSNGYVTKEESRGPAASKAWVDEGKSEAELLAEKVENEGRELAGTITEEASEKDFAPSELPEVIRMRAEEVKVPTEDLRAAVLRSLAKDFDVSEGRMRQIRAALDPTKASAEKAPTTAKQGKVDDFGEKLEGARKDKTYSLSREVSDDDFISQPLGKVWPANEFEQYDDPYTAAVAYAARAEVPAKPRKEYALKRWLEKVKGVRELAQKLATGSVTLEKFKQGLNERHGLHNFRDKVELLAALPREQWKRIDGQVQTYPDAQTYEDGKKIVTPISYVTIDGRHHRFDGATLDLVLPKVKELLDAKPAPEQKLEFEVRGSGTVYFINKKGDREYRHLKEFTTSKEAIAFRSDPANYDALVAAWDEVKDRDNVKETDLRSTENRPRTGADHRAGKDVTAEQFQQAFGFRGGQFGNWVSHGEGAKDRQGMLNQAYDALMDLAEILGIPPRAISLNGTLGIAFGARGHGWASAHFEPNTLVINLTKTRGAGALGHEWFHAVDNYFARARNNGEETPFRPGTLNAQEAYRQQNFITYRPEPMMTNGITKMSKVALEQARRRMPGNPRFNEEKWRQDPDHKAGVRPEVETRWANLVRTLDEAPMKERAAKIDGGTGYWSQIIERAARSFESFLLTRMAEKGYHNDYLSNVTPPEMFKRAADRYPYLLASEVAPVAKAFDELFGSMQTKETDKGLALFNQSETGETALATPQHVGQLQAFADAIREGWARAPEVVVTSSVAAPATPQAVRQEARKLIANGGNVPSGVWFEGRVYLFADKLSTNAKAAEVLFHEVLGHMGLRGAFGKDLEAILRQISQVRRAEVNRIIKRNGFDESERLRAAEELLGGDGADHAAPGVRAARHRGHQDVPAQGRHPVGQRAQQRRNRAQLHPAGARMGGDRRQANRNPVPVRRAGVQPGGAPQGPARGAGRRRVAPGQQRGGQGAASQGAGANQVLAQLRRPLRARRAGPAQGLGRGVTAPRRRARWRRHPFQPGSARRERPARLHERGARAIQRVPRHARQAELVAKDVRHALRPGAAPTAVQGRLRQGAAVPQRHQPLRHRGGRPGSAHPAQAGHVARLEEAADVRGRHQGPHGAGVRGHPRLLARRAWPAGEDGRPREEVRRPVDRPEGQDAGGPPHRDRGPVEAVAGLGAGRV
jgi:hypothetical protein